MIEVNKIISNIDLVSEDKLFKMATYQAMRGHPLKLFKRHSRVIVRANSFSMRVIDTWNSLPSNVVLAPSMGSFESRLNKCWHGHLKFRAMVLGSFQYRDVLLLWHMLGQGPAVLAAGAGRVGCLLFCSSRLSYLPFLMPHLSVDGWTY